MTKPWESVVEDVCTYIRTYTYMDVCTYVSMYVCMYVCLFNDLELSFLLKENPFSKINKMKFSMTSKKMPSILDIF